MVNIAVNSATMNRPGGYLTPRIGAAIGNAPVLPRNQAFALDTSLKAEDNILKAIGGYVVAAPVDVADSMLALFPGIERGQISRGVYDAVGATQFGNWVEENQGGVEVASGLLGALTVAYGAEYLMAKVGTSAWAASTGLGRAVTSLNTATNKAEQAAKSATLLAAQEGRTLHALEGANLAYVRLNTLRMGAKTAVSEAAVVAAMNQNDFIWDDDIGWNMLWMGIGVGAGAALGRIQGKSAMNRWANSPDVRLANAAYNDPEGYTGTMNEALMQALDRTVQAGYRVHPKQSSIITAMQLQARNADTPSLRAAQQKQWEAEANRVLSTMTQRGSVGINSSKFSLSSTEGQQLLELLHDDPTGLYAASSVASFGGKTADEILDARKTFINGLRLSLDPKKPPKPADVAKANALEKEIPMVLVNRSWTTVDEAADLVNWTPGNIEVKPVKNTLELSWDSGSIGKVVVREDGSINKKWESLGIKEILQVVHMQNKLMENLLKKNLPIKLGKNATWQQMDMAVEYASRGGIIDMQELGLKNIDDLQIKSLQLKHGEVKDLDLTFANRLRFNLPLSTSFERVRDPSGLELKTLLLGSTNAGATIQDLKNFRTSLAQTFDLLSNTKTTDRLDGDLFHFNRSRKDQKWMQPVLGFFEDKPRNMWTKWNLGEEIMMNEAVKVNAMTSQASAPFVSNLTKMITGNPDLYRRLGNIAELADNMVNTTRNALSHTLGQFLTKAQIARNQETLLAAQAMRRVVNRVVENKVDDALKNITPLVDRVSAMSGTKSRVLFNQYASWANGWDISKAELGRDGFWRFVLRDDSANNASRLGRPVQKGEWLMTPDGSKEIVLDDTGNELRVALEDEYNRILHETNAIRIAKGQEPITVKAFYTPPRSVTGRFVGFTLGPNNKVIPGGAIVADSPEEYRALVQKLEKQLGPGERIMSREQIESSIDLWEASEIGFHDPTYMMKPSGVRSKGALSESRINPHALEDALEYIKRGYEQIGNGTLRTIFDSQLRAARVHSVAQHNALKGVSRGKESPKNIFDIYEETLLGIPASRDSRGLAGVGQAIDQKLDSWLESTSWAPATQTKQWVRDLLDKAPVPGGMASKLKPFQSFDELAAQLGPYTPFANAVEYAEHINGIKPPWKSKELARHVNRVAAGAILRWLELPHALMNISGIITNMPAILGASNVPMIGKVGGVGVIDSMKIMSFGIKRMMSPESRRDWVMMVRNGDATQDVAELHHQASMMQGKNSFMRVLTGDPRYANWRSIKDPRRRTEAMLRFKGIEGMASVMTDESENFSRQVSHFIGLQLADYHGITGMEARHAFARQIANDAIANYDPLNRPEIYQSALGSMYGLFLSYMQNWYQRLFRYMEAGEYKALGRQLTMQASLYGFTGLPGARALGDMIGGEEEGDGLLDNIYKRYGPAVGSVVAHGGLNQFTRIFGIEPVSLHTRGDANFRHPGLDFVTGGLRVPVPVGLEVIKDLVSGTFELAGHAVSEGRLPDARYVSEILARDMPSRTLKGMMSVLALKGQEVDAYGNVMSETKTWAEGLYRMMGLRSLRQQAEIEAYFTNQKAQAIDAARLEPLRRETRAMIRSGNMDNLDEVFQRYIDAGGAPWNYSTWIRGLIQDANNTRAQNQLLTSLRSPSNQMLAHRIMLYTGQQ